MFFSGANGTIKQAMATYDTAQSLGLSIGPEATATLLNAKSRPASSDESGKKGIFSRLFGAFSTSSESKK